MAKGTASSSSSSSEEDLTAFQSVAVSFEEITSKQKEVAEQAKQRIAGSSKRKRNVEKKPRGKGEDGVGPEQESGGDDDDGPLDQLDPFQLKVAASLDAMLEGRLRHKEPGPKKRRRETRAAERAEAEAEADGSFRFFARVKLREPVVLQPYEPPPPLGIPFPDVFRSRRAPAAEEAAAALPALAVDGAALLAGSAAVATAAAAAAGTAGAADAATAAGAAQAGGSAEQVPPLQTKKDKKKKDKGKQRHLGEGVVVDPRVFVPHEERIGRLVGAAPGLAC